MLSSDTLTPHKNTFIMKVARFVFNMFGENTYVIWEPESGQAAVIDPGMTEQAERDALDSFIERNHLTVSHLVNTHMHLDHIFGNAYVRERYGVKVEANPADNFLGTTLGDQCARFGIRNVPQSCGVETELNDGDSFMLGDEKVQVIAVPGHSPGGIALYCPESGFVLTGDSLFQGSIGRTDLPGGNFTQLVGSVRSKLLTLPPETVVLPGHGGETTVGRELEANPFVR